MIDPVERDLKEYLRDREEEYQRRCACEGRWDSMRENIKRELLEALELLSPFHTNTNGEKLDAFLDRLADIHDEVEGLKGEWK